MPEGHFTVPLPPSHPTLSIAVQASPEQLTVEPFLHLAVQVPAASPPIICFNWFLDKDFV
jgi:hypothetical protein